MKRCFSAILAILLLVCLLPCNTLAAEPTTANESIEYYADGSYLVTTITESVSRASGTKTQSKAQSYYDSSDNLEWKITLTGTFTYNGTSATCTSASCNVDVYASNWYLISKSASKSGNTASSDVTMGQKLLGITISKPNYTMTLTCDKDGNFS